MAYLHSLVRRSIHINLSTDRPEIIIAWAERSLYVMLFIAFLVVMGQFHVFITYTYLASVFCLVLPVLFGKEEGEVAESN